MLEIYTDGGCRNNPGIGAWAIVIIENGEIINTSSCHYKHTTNNEMELKAIYHALLFAKMFGESDVTICSDSQYSINAITQWFPKWLSSNTLEGKKNVELLRKIHTLMLPSIRFVWVKGHANNKYNIMADRLVNGAMNAALAATTFSHSSNNFKS